MIIVFIFVTISLFVKYESISTTCDQLSPCNYSFVQNKLEENCDIIFLDQAINTKDHLNDFHSLINNIPVNQCQILGQNTYIDGIFLTHSLRLNIENKHFSFSNFIYSNFRFPLIYLFDSSKFSISNVYFSSQMYFDGINSEFTFSNVTYTKIAKGVSSAFHFKSCIVNFLNVNVNNIIMSTHETDGFIELSNSSLKIKKSNFANLTVHNGSLISSNNNSSLKFKDCLFEHGIYFHLICSLENSLNRVRNCTFNHNYGHIYYSIDTRDELFEKTIFKNNIHPFSTLFAFNNSGVNFREDCQLYKNSAVGMFYFSGVDRQLQISNTVFQFNRFQLDLFILENCNFVVTRTVFDSNWMNGDFIKMKNCKCFFTENRIESFFVRSFIFSKDSVIQLTDTVFSPPVESTSPFISLNRFSILKIQRSRFLFSLFSNEIIWSDHSSVATVNNSQFNQSFKSIKVRNKIDLSDCEFNEDLHGDINSHFYSFSFYHFALYLILFFLGFEILKTFLRCPQAKMSSNEEEEEEEDK